MRVKFIDVRREFNLVDEGKEKKIFGKILCYRKFFDCLFKIFNFGTLFLHY